MAEGRIEAAEVARVLDVSRRQVAQLAASEADFPASEVGPGGYRLWAQASIDAWASSHPVRGPAYEAPEASVAEPRLHGTPERITPELQHIFELAVSEATSLNHSWLGGEHIVLALLRPECPGAARMVLRSLGLTLEGTRDAWVESMGDPYDPQELELVVPPATRFPFERAKLEALDLRDEQVTSEHLLLDLIDPAPQEPSDPELARALVTPSVMSSPNLLWRVRSSKDVPSVLAMFFDWRGTHARAVRDRVIALTEDPTRHFDPPQRLPVEPKRRWAGREPELTLSPLGHHPERRRPWGSGVFSRPDGTGTFKQGKALLQYFIDRDGYPVLTTEGNPVHVLIDAEGNHVLGEDGEVQLTAIDVPPRSEPRPYRLEDWR